MLKGKSEVLVCSFSQHCKFLQMGSLLIDKMLSPAEAGKENPVRNRHFAADGKNKTRVNRQ
ncbi:MAG: hypothetical protein HY885_06155 [Deltaproteobacteria bacterium]|nr:hypothetical protein [Deltaproteobacteria bacterium]